MVTLIKPVSDSSSPTTPISHLSNHSDHRKVVPKLRSPNAPYHLRLRVAIKTLFGEDIGIEGANTGRLWKRNKLLC
jgi:hypothetical protein